jgi:hypothetical protein
MLAMPRVRPRARWPRLLGVALLVAIATLVLQGAVAPHTHAGVRPGLYNQDHDLVLLATLHGAAVLHATQPAPFVVCVRAALTPPGTQAPASAAPTTADSRAPPLV